MGEKPLSYETRPQQPSFRGFWIVAWVVIIALVLFALWFAIDFYLFLKYDD